MKSFFSVLIAFLPWLACGQQAMYENTYLRPVSGAGQGVIIPPGYLTNGLVEWNRFNDGSGSLAADASGNGNTLPLWGSPAWGQGFINFNGSTQYADAGQHQLVSLDLHDLTICAWINKTGNNLNGIVDKGYSFGGTNYGGWGFWVMNNGRLNWWVTDQQDIQDSGPINLVQGQWAFVAVVWHYSQKSADFYINGVLNSSGTNTAVLQQSSDNPNGPLEIGNIHDNIYTGSFVWNGSLRDIGFYNRALGASEILSNYNGTLPHTNVVIVVTPPSTNVVVPDLLYYKMTESAQTTFPAFLIDSSTHGGTTGTVTATDTNVLNWVTNVASVPAAAMSFDGATRLQTGVSTLFNFTTNLFTINLWVRPLAANGTLLGNAVYQANGWYLSVGPAYQIQFGTETGGSDNFITTGAGALQAGAWNMVTLVRTAPSTALVYINGIITGTTGNITSPSSSSSNLLVGVDGPGAHYFDGDIWLAQIWSQALADSAVSNLYAAQLSGQPWPPATAVVGAGGGSNSTYLTNGLVEWNRLDDGSGTEASDSSGNGNTVPLVGNPAWGSSYLTLDGSTQYGNAGSNQLSSLDVHDMTICAWINKTSSSFKGIVDKHLDIPGFYGGWGFWVLPNNHLQWWVEDGQNLTDYGGGEIQLGQWTFVSVVWHHSVDEADYYINGVLDAKVINGGANQGPGLTAVLELGNLSANSTATNYAFDGSMRDVGIYNRALLPAEIQYNFQHSAPTTNVSLPDLLYYKMTEVAQTNPPAFLVDSSTRNGVAGTLVVNHPATLQWVTNAASVPGAAVHFNGVSTHIDTSNTVSFNFTTNLFTINFWVRTLTANGYLFQNGTDLTNGWCVKVGGAYQIQFGTEANGTESLITTQPSTAQPEIWNMVTIVRTSVTNALIYINGVQALTTGSISNPASSTNSLVLGTDRLGDHFYDGDMWLPQIWGEALPGTDIANLYFMQSLGLPWP